LLCLTPSRLNHSTSRSLSFGQSPALAIHPTVGAAQSHFQTKTKCQRYGIHHHNQLLLLPCPTHGGELFSHPLADLAAVTMVLEKKAKSEVEMKTRPRKTNKQTKTSKNETQKNRQRQDNEAPAQQSRKGN
jgi:hypothetical protein